MATERFEEAFLRAKMEFPIIPKRGINPFYKSSAHPTGSPYALYEDIVSHANPVLHKYGLFFRHSSRLESGVYLVGSFVTSATSGSSGNVFEMPIPMDTPQKTSAGITYAKRVTLASVLGLETDTDNDANETVEHRKSIIRPIKKDSGATITKEQYLELLATAEKCSWLARDVMEYIALDYGVNKSSDLTQKDFEDLKKVMSTKTFKEAKESLHG